MIRVAVIVLNWNGLGDTLECLESLRLSDYPSLETTVVDNGSADRSVAEVRQTHPEVRVIENGRNLGFAKGNNIGLRAALERSPELVLLLNNDTVLRPDCISHLVEAMCSDESIGVAGPLMQRALPPDLIEMGGQVNFWTGVARARRFDPAVHVGQIEGIDYAWGCALMARAEVLRKVGLLDERYTAYYEDADLCMRARAAGYRTVVATRAWMLHKWGRSGDRRFLWQTWLRLRNHWWFFLRYARPNQRVTLLPALLFYFTPIMLLQAARVYAARKAMPRYRSRPISLWPRPPER